MYKNNKTILTCKFLLKYNIKQQNMQWIDAVKWIFLTELKFNKMGSFMIPFYYIYYTETFTKVNSND